ncbi:aminoacyl-tRNA hydrolase [Aphanothece hegewaldii CCALA 016]|uniref:Peptidyl-tRNA hydrolase n=1 Tax=Aphanothece hegewaldii CCALA 016 TaxID=2107694 RepID=A0A2T1LRP0_9CHRO|nr:aminoacyl-tRNA hydrolase [Aphanothece hegewaldii]PSF31426.1 aminoacyl-tRNA hydrolase [Aphanothece hegewaldii CCALA 016]
MTQTNSKPIVIPQLIVGLGNPEEKYHKTRHNIGFEAVDILVQSWGLSWQQNKRFFGFFTEGQHRGNKIRLLKPTTYMNRSGQAVQAVLDWYKLSPESVLVIYDDMDLPLGKLRLRLSGSAGGHNGMKSIISHLNSQNFPRLRIGIGKDQQKETISHVLGKFSPQEAQITSEILKVAEKAVDLSLKEGFEKSMSLYNSFSVVNEP